jgi:hypothetical protein
MKLVLGVILGFTVVGAILLAGASFTLRFNWVAVILWTGLIPVMLGVGIWQVLAIIEGQCTGDRQIAS